MSPSSDSLRIAEECCATKRWSQAEAWFQLAVAEDSGPRAAIAYGAFLAERQRFHPAISLLMQGLDRAQAASDLHRQAQVFSHLATIYRELGEFDLAQRFQRKVLAIHDAADACDLLDWATDALLAGNLSLSEQLARSAWLLVEDSEDLETQADVQGLLGVLAARLGEHRPAVLLLIRAARAHQHIGDDRGLGVDYQNLAEITGLLGRTGWQRKFFAAAKSCFARAGMPVSGLRVLRRLQDLGRLELYRKMVADWN